MRNANKQRFASDFQHIPQPFGVAGGADIGFVIVIGSLGWQIACTECKITHTTPPYPRSMTLK